MKALLICFAAAILFIGNANARQQQSKNTKIYESSFEFVPNNLAVTSDDLPVPVSLSVDNAFVEGRNIFELKPLEPQEIAAADEKAEAVSPGPLRVGLTETI